MSVYYPVLPNLEGRRCVVVGGGWETLERVRGLLDAGAQVTQISPTPSPEIERLAKEGRIAWHAREFEAADLDGAFLAISCPADRASNAQVWAAAEARGIPIDAIDDPLHYSFIFPAIHRQGGLIIAVFSSGKSPALAARIRDRIAGEFGAQHGQFIEMLGQLRPEMLQRFPDFDCRRAIWYKLVDSPALDRLQAGRPEAALAELRAILDPA
jgi:siroheme synthase-like protein